jgi:hypothetical protein
MPNGLLDPALAPRQFVHDKCGATSQMPDDMVAGYLANPHRFNDWAYCSKCDGFVSHRECRWAETKEPLDAYFRRLKAAVPAPPAAGWLPHAVATILTAVGGAIGYGVGGHHGLWLGLLAGLGLGLLLVIAKSLGLR